MIGTVIIFCIAVVALAAVGVGQFQVWQRWQRRAQRQQVLDSLLSPRSRARGTRLDPVPSSRAARPAPPLPASVTRPRNPVDRMALWLRDHRGARRAVSVVAGVMALAAIVIIAYPLLTDLYTSKLQDHLRNQLNSRALAQDYRDHTVKIGDALTRIEIPAIGVDVVVVEGTTTSALRAGAGHYVTTALPCANGNVGIAGHRTTYGKPFHDIDKLKAGDQIILQTPVGACTYHVDRAPFAVSPTDVEVLDPPPAGGPKGMLTLTTCHPPGSASQRLIVQADRADAAAKARTKPS